jgi:hypothetical protein
VMISPAAKMARKAVAIRMEIARTPVLSNTATLQPMIYCAGVPASLGAYSEQHSLHDNQGLAPHTSEDKKRWLLRSRD